MGRFSFLRAFRRTSRDITIQYTVVTSEATSYTAGTAHCAAPSASGCRGVRVPTASDRLNWAERRMKFRLSCRDQMVDVASVWLVVRYNILL